MEAAYKDHPKINDDEVEELMKKEVEICEERAKAFEEKTSNEVINQQSRALQRQ